LLKKIIRIFMSNDDNKDNVSFNTPDELLDIFLNSSLSYDELIKFAKEMAEQIKEPHTNLEGQKYAAFTQCILECYKRIYEFDSSRWCSEDRIGELSPKSDPIVFVRKLSNNQNIRYCIYNSEQLERKKIEDDTFPAKFDEDPFEKIQFDILYLIFKNNGKISKGDLIKIFTTNGDSLTAYSHLVGINEINTSYSKGAMGLLMGAVKSLQLGGFLSYIDYKYYTSCTPEQYIKIKKIEKSDKDDKEDKDDNSLVIKNIIRLIENKHNVFITGHAGTGKSYILEKLKSRFRKMVVTSTTGIAAVNVKGQTLHSWAGVGICKVPVDITIQHILSSRSEVVKRIKKTSLLAIDEISMLKKDTLEYVDKVLKAIKDSDKPFGGIQVVFIGDFFQLPPVEDEYKNDELYCFESELWEKFNFKNVVLTENYRQHEEDFITALANMRKNCLTTQDVELLKSRIIFDADSYKNVLHIFSTNKETDLYNEINFNSLQTPIYEFAARDGVMKGEKFEYETLTEKDVKILDILDKNCKVNKHIKLRQGCRVMLVMNLSFNEGLINGSCGTVDKINDNSIIVRFDNGSIKKINRESFEYYYNNKLMAKRLQFPLRLAYAITIHKSQGMTLDKLFVDCKRIFENGQAYVALSRVKELSGLYLCNFSEELVYTDPKVASFYEQLVAVEFNDNKSDLFKSPKKNDRKNKPIFKDYDEATRIIEDIILSADGWIEVFKIADKLGVKRHDRLVNNETQSTIAHIINRFLKRKGFKALKINYDKGYSIWVASGAYNESQIPEYAYTPPKERKNSAIRQ